MPGKYLTCTNMLEIIRIFWKDRTSLKHVQTGYGNILTSLNIYGTSLDSCVPCCAMSGACVKQCVNISGIILDMSATHLDMSQDILKVYV